MSTVANLAKVVFLAAVATGIAVGPSEISSAFAAPAAKSSGGLKTASLFGRSALVLNAGQMDKWRAVLSRHRSQSNSPEWRSLVAKARSGPGEGSLERVNRIVNGIRPVSDPSDRWKPPTEFLRDGGDCEEYAITKFLLLRELGVPASAMRVLALYARPGVPAHAVLVVDTPRGSTVLDNMRSGTYGLGRGVTSRAAYAFNEIDWWITVENRSLLAASQ